MRRSKITGLLLIMGMFLAGCGANSGSAGIEEDAVMQELYDRSEIARGYTDPIFQEYLDQYDSDCEIKETSFGFEPAETPAQAQYFVEYQYSNGLKCPDLSKHFLRFFDLLLASDHTQFSGCQYTRYSGSRSEQTTM